MNLIIYYLEGDIMLKRFEEHFNLDATIAKDLFKNCNYPWEVLPKIKEFIMGLIPNLGDEYEEVDENVFIHKEAKVANSACIVGPTIICKGADIRHCAYIRGSVIVGENSVVGNSTEVKNAIIFIVSSVIAVPSRLQKSFAVLGLEVFAL